MKGFNEYIAGLLSKYNVLDEIQSEMNSSLEEFKNDIQIYNYININNIMKNSIINLLQKKT